MPLCICYVLCLFVWYLVVSCACLFEFCFPANRRKCSKFLVKPNSHIHIETNIKQTDCKPLSWYLWLGAPLVSCWLSVLATGSIILVVGSVTVCIFFPYFIIIYSFPRTSNKSSLNHEPPLVLMIKFRTDGYGDWEMLDLGGNGNMWMKSCFTINVPLVICSSSSKQTQLSLSLPNVFGYSLWHLTWCLWLLLTPPLLGSRCVSVFNYFLPNSKSLIPSLIVG